MALGRLVRTVRFVLGRAGINLAAERLTYLQNNRKLIPEHEPGE